MLAVNSVSALQLSADLWSLRSKETTFHHSPHLKTLPLWYLSSAFHVNIGSSFRIGQNKNMVTFKSTQTIWCWWLCSVSSSRTQMLCTEYFSGDTINRSCRNVFENHYLTCVQLNTRLSRTLITSNNYRQRYSCRDWHRHCGLHTPHLTLWLNFTSVASAC